MTNPFAANDIADNLNLLQQLAVTVAEQQNQHVDEFNHAIGTIESLEQQLAALRTELDNQKALNVKIHEDRLAILNKHNESVNTANSEIRRLQTRSAEAEITLAELRKIDPERMKRLYEAQKEQNAELKKTNERLQSKNTELEQRNKKLRADLQLSHEGVWGFGVERIIPYQGEVVGVKDGVRSKMSSCVWWHHEKGVRLLCGYKPETDEIIICDPCQDDSSNIVVPSAIADKAMKDYFKKLAKAEKKQQNKKAA